MMVLTSNVVVLEYFALWYIVALFVATTTVIIPALAIVGVVCMPLLRILLPSVSLFVGFDDLVLFSQVFTLVYSYKQFSLGLDVIEYKVRRSLFVPRPGVVVSEEEEIVSFDFPLNTCAVLVTERVSFF